MQKCVNLVELEKRCQTYIYLQESASIKPRTSLPKHLTCLQGILLLPDLAKHVATPGGRGARGGELRRDPAPDAGARHLDGARHGHMAKFRQNFAHFRLYRRRSFQVNHAFCSIFQNLPDYFIYLAEIFEIWQKFANCATFAKMLLHFHENC